MRKTTALAMNLVLLASGATAFGAVEYTSRTAASPPSSGARATNAIQFTLTGGEVGPEIRGSRAGNVKNSSAFIFQYQWQPAVLQRFGIVGIGPNISAYPAVKARGQVINGYRNGWGLGSQLSWQGKFSGRQWLLPVVSYAAEYNIYSLTGGERGSFWSHGPRIGAWLLLNAIDPTDTDRQQSDYGSARTYAILEYSNVRSGNGAGRDIDIRGNAIQFGLRFEY